tara:strand:- start:105 stop:1367 length:1263 start_codon:yes stop_codon:yes gene_type:complete
MTFEKCMIQTKSNLKKRGFENHEEIAAGMCSMWAEENGVEREFAEGKSTEPTRRTFALTMGEEDNIKFSSDEGIDSVEFPVIAITSGPHEYEVDGEQHKVYIEGGMLKDNLEKFSELPIYIDHQRTAEDLIGMATKPELIKMDNGKTAVQMLATVSNQYGRGQEVMDKVKDGDMTHVSIDWFSNDIDVMGDTYATNIRPTEVSFIDNEKMDPVCKECTIEEGKECDAQVSKDDHDCGCGGEEEACACEDGKTEVEVMSEETKETTVKSEAENIVEREFASLRSQLEEVEASKAEIEAEFKKAMKELEAFKKAEEERLAAEAEAKKLETVEAIISREILFGSIEEDKKDARVEELSAWDESRLTGFSDALAAMPEPSNDVERSFGKGKTAEEGEVPETKREFGMKMVKGRITLDPSYYKEK